MIRRLFLRGNKETDAGIIFAPLPYTRPRRTVITLDKGEIMPNGINSPGEVQQAIRLGAITGEYKADTQRVIQALNALRSTEIMSYLQYMQHQYMAVSLLSPVLN